MTQYQYISWMDHKAPSSPFGFCQLALQLIEKEDFLVQPIIVHCRLYFNRFKFEHSLVFFSDLSAGIGRTGTFLLSLVTIKEYERTGKVDIEAALNLLRNGRAKLVENMVSIYYLGYDKNFDFSCFYRINTFSLIN